MLLAGGHLAEDTAGLYDAANVSVVHHVNQALRANVLYQRDKDYIVRAGEVILIDEFTGRMMHGRRLSEGLHQAIEAKEGVDHPAREPDPGLGDHPELLPPLREAVGHDRHGRDRGPGIPRHLQDGRGRDPDQPAGDRGSTTTTRSIAPPPRRTWRSSARSRTAIAAASRSWSAPSRSRSPSSSRSCSKAHKFEHRRQDQQGHPAQRAERPLPRAGSLHRRRRRRAGRGDHRHQHGRPRHRHPARRQRRHAAGRSWREEQRGLGIEVTPEMAAEAQGRDRGRDRRAEGSRRWPPAASSCSAPSATRAGASTTSCAAAPAARATRATRSSSCPARTTCCASSPASGWTRSCAPSASRKARRSPTSG